VSAWPAGAIPEHTPEDEAEVIGRALAGDREAFGCLVDWYQVPVRRVTRAVLHDADEADDAAQDAFLSALVKLHQYDRRRPFRPWLMRIAANVAIDRQRRRTVRHVESLAPDAASRDAGPDVQAERSALRERLEAALRQLPERYRIAVVLYDVEGFSHPEIAEALGIPVGTVRSAVFHARRQLRPLMEDWREGS
jgi:RNA polymerase sigma-70 factor, ECF subfamily